MTDKDSKHYPEIKVFITKKGKIRAKIQDIGEVTIGGQSWKEGKGQKHLDRIKRKADKLCSMIQQQFINHLM